MEKNIIVGVYKTCLFITTGFDIIGWLNGKEKHNKLHGEYNEYYNEMT